MGKRDGQRPEPYNPRSRVNRPMVIPKGKPSPIRDLFLVLFIFFLLRMAMLTGGVGLFPIPVVDPVVMSAARGVNKFCKTSVEWIKGAVHGDYSFHR